MTYRNMYIQVYTLNFGVGQLSLCLLTGLSGVIFANMTPISPKLGRGGFLKKFL